MKTIKILLFCIITLFLPMHLPAKQNKELHKKIDAQDNDSLTGKKCCTNYSDIKKLIRDIEKIEAPKPKDEFETTKQYNERIEALTNKNKDIIDVCYMFPLDTKTGWAKYDADNQVMHFGIIVTRPLIFHKDVNESQYLGKTAFGFQKLITKTDEKEFCINSVEVAKKNLSQLDKLNNRSILLDNYKIGVEDAKKLKNSYAILVLIKPKKSNEDGNTYTFINYKSFHVEPTINSPRDEKVTSSILNAIILEAIVVDTSDGKVLQQKIFSNHSPCLNKFIIKDNSQ